MDISLFLLLEHSPNIWVAVERNDHFHDGTSWIPNTHISVLFPGSSCVFKKETPCTK